MTINYRDLVIEAEVSRRRGIGIVPRNTDVLGTKGCFLPGEGLREVGLRLRQLALLPAYEAYVVDNGDSVWMVWTMEDFHTRPGATVAGFGLGEPSSVSLDHA